MAVSSAGGRGESGSVASRHISTVEVSYRLFLVPTWYIACMHELKPYVLVNTFVQAKVTAVNGSSKKTMLNWKRFRFT